MDNTNLFIHAPKELVTDAFLTWLLYFLDSKVEYQKYKQQLFNELFLSKNDFKKNVSEIEVRRQVDVNGGRIDLLVEFNLDNAKQTILFENKTWTTTNQDQLQKYKEGLPNLYKYIYLKLAYLNYAERKLTEKVGYKPVTSKMLYDTLKNMSDLHPFINQYVTYIKETFVNYINGFHKAIFGKNRNEDRYGILENHQAQQYLMDILYKDLDGKLNHLNFKTGSSSGRPWTQLDIARKEKVYENIEEFLFWRIDKRNGKYYIRLNQYAYIKNSNKPEFIEMKKRTIKNIKRNCI